MIRHNPDYVLSILLTKLNSMGKILEGKNTSKMYLFPFNGQEFLTVSNQNCGGCQRFESAYLQLVNLADTKLYDSTQFFRFGSSIYDFSFMDVDRILPFSSTLGWHSLKVKGEVQTRSHTGHSGIRFKRNLSKTTHRW